MNRKQIEQFVSRYFRATGCEIVEKGSHHLTVRLSPQADRDLTNRPYYWNFVDRTGAEPETMTFRFVFDREAYAREAERQEGAGTKAKPEAPRGDSILGRYFGVGAVPVGSRRIPEEDLTYGSRRLAQIFASVRGKGRFVQLFEEPDERPGPVGGAAPLSSWLCVNYKVEMVCDMLKSEIHSLGISLSGGEIVEGFHDLVRTRKLTPRLPARTHVRETISLVRAAGLLEARLQQRLKTYDHGWADEAEDRLRDELARIESYYEDVLAGAEDESKPAIQEQYANRKMEIEWQYRPRIQVSVIGCGLFHLANEPIRAGMTNSAIIPQK